MMIGAADKQNLIDLMEIERAAWDALIDRFPENRLVQPGVEADWSVKDVIAHVTSYEDWTADQIELYARGEVPSAQELANMGDRGWYDVDTRNRYAYEQNKDKPLEQVLTESQDAFNRLLQAVEGLSSEQLALPQWWTGGLTLFDAIPSQTFKHYHQHLDPLKAWLSEGDPVSARSEQASHYLS